MGQDMMGSQSLSLLLRLIFFYIFTEFDKRLFTVLYTIYNNVRKLIL